MLHSPRQLLISIAGGGSQPPSGDVHNAAATTACTTEPWHCSAKRLRIAPGRLCRLLAAVHKDEHLVLARRLHDLQGNTVCRAADQNQHEIPAPHNKGSLTTHQVANRHRCKGWDPLFYCSGCRMKAPVPHLAVADLVHELETLQRLLHCHANVLLSQWARPAGGGTWMHRAQMLNQSLTSQLRNPPEYCHAGMTHGHLRHSSRTSGTAAGAGMSFCELCLHQRCKEAPEGVVEVEQPLLGLDPQEGRHVLKVGQRGRQAHQPHHLLGGLQGRGGRRG